MRIYVNDEGFVKLRPFEGATVYDVADDQLPSDFWRAVYFGILKYSPEEGFSYSIDTSKAVILTGEVLFDLVGYKDPETGEISGVPAEFDEMIVLGSGGYNKVYRIIPLNENNNVLIRVISYIKYSDLKDEDYRAKIVPQKQFKKLPMDKYLTPKELTLKVQLLDEALLNSYKHRFFDWLHDASLLDLDNSSNIELKPDDIGGIVVPSDPEQEVVILTKDLVANVNDFSPVELVFAAVGNLVETVSYFKIEYTTDDSIWNEVMYAGRFMTQPITFDTAPTLFKLRLSFKADIMSDALPYLEAWGVVWKNSGE